MRYDPTIHHRRSIRLKNFNYASPGFYFVTFCSHGRVPHFGRNLNNLVVLTSAGKMLEQEWQNLPQTFPTISLDEFVVMPDHVHAVIQILRDNSSKTGIYKRPTLGQIVGAYKSITTNSYIAGIRNQDWPAFEKAIWQRNFYDTIIKSEAQLENIRHYIRNNPAQKASRPQAGGS